MILWNDYETASGDVNLVKEGVFKYAPSCRILLNAWTIDDHPVVVEEGLSRDYLYAHKHADQIIAHNAGFDRTVLSHKIADVRANHWYCTMAQAVRHGLPGSLEQLCEIFNLSESDSKDKDGRRLVLKFCKPDSKGRWHDAQTDPQDWERFKLYAGKDVHSMRLLHRLMPRWNDRYEMPIWLLDQSINERGMLIDVEFVNKMIALIKSAKGHVNEEVTRATDGRVTAVTQRDRLLGYLLSNYGVSLPDLSASVLERRLNDTDLPDAVRELISLRLDGSKSSTAKYATLARRVSEDGILRGALAYCGARRTKRWAGYGFQPQNLPRPHLAGIPGKALTAEIEAGIVSVKAETFDLFHEHAVSEFAASAVRGCVIARPGTKFVVADYSNVEGRMLAWLAGEHWKLKAFQEYDEGIGEDLYKLSYARAFNVDPATVIDDQRQVGKVMELMLGYEGGVSAFVTGATTYRVDLNAFSTTVWPYVSPEHRRITAKVWEFAVSKKMTFGLPEIVYRSCDALKRMWRERHPNVVKFWDELRVAFLSALGAENGHEFRVGHLTVKRIKSWVVIKGPCGDCISYPRAVASIVNDRETISYWGVDAITKKWCQQYTYGGKLAENVTQWLCRNLLAEALLKVNGRGFHTPLHVHDEIVCEVPMEMKEGACLQLMQSCMTEVPWAQGLPLSTSTKIMTRYSKG